MKAHDLGAVLATIGVDELNLSRGDPSRVFERCVIAPEGRDSWLRRDHRDETAKAAGGFRDEARRAVAAVPLKPTRAGVKSLR